MRRFTDYIILIATAIIFTLYHAVLTSLVISASEELELRFSYIFGVELLAFLPVALAMLIIIWVSKISPRLFSSFSAPVISFHIIMATGLFVIHAIWQSFINASFFGSPFNAQEIIDDFMGFLVMRFFLYIIIVGLVSGIVKLRENRRAASKSSRLQMELQKAKMKELELKMNPEIIYPNLGYIKMNAEHSPESASQMVILMAGLLRKLVDNLDSEKIKLGDDVQFYRMYINMVNLRLERVIETSVDIQGINTQTRVPSMVLMVPFLEELFFGKYSTYLDSVNKITYQVSRIDRTQTNISLLFQPLKSLEGLQDAFENETMIKLINQQLDQFTSNEFHFDVSILHGKLVLHMSIFSPSKVGEMHG